MSTIKLGMPKGWDKQTRKAIKKANGVLDTRHVRPASWEVLLTAPPALDPVIAALQHYGAAVRQGGSSRCFGCEHPFAATNLPAMFVVVTPRGSPNHVLMWPACAKCSEGDTDALERKCLDEIGLHRPLPEGTA